MKCEYIVYKFGIKNKIEETATLNNWTEIVKYVKRNKKSNKHFEVYQDGQLLLKIAGKIK